MRDRSTFAMDEAGAEAGDRGFIGVQMRLEPNQLAPGYCSQAINARFRSGVAETRRGIVLIPWTNKLVGVNRQPWGTVFGTGRFLDPTTATEYIVIATASGVFYTYENSTAQTLGLPAGESIEEPVEFFQCFNALVMLRGREKDPLVMTDLSEGFVAIEQTPELDESGTLPIPRARRGIYMANRLFLVPLRTVTDFNDETAQADDTIVASDILDYTRYTIRNEMRINQGEDDRIVQIAKFGTSTMIVLKRKSVYRVDNVFGDLSQVTLSLVTDRYGCIAPESVVNVGTDLLWLSQEGVASLALTEFGEIQAREGARSGKPEMFSEAIQPLIDRINWVHAENAKGHYWNNRYYLAVPLDDAEVLEPDIAGTIPTALVSTIVPTVAGASYRFEKGVNESSLENGAQTLTASAEFIAAGTSVTINRTAFSEMTSTVRRVYKAINNAVLVYDFLNRAWSGHDEGDGITPSDWFIFNYRIRQRLFMVDHLGWVKLYEEDFEDHLPVPYMDLEFIADCNDALSFSVNGGSTITQDLGTPANSATQIGVASGISTDQENLWTDPDQQGGYSPINVGNLWTAPNTTPARIPTGVRFYATNGVPPTAEIVSDDDSLRMAQYTTQDIAFTMITRAYESDVGDISDYQYASIDLQTWSPLYSISLMTEGVEEDFPKVSAKERDRSAWYKPFNKPAFDQTNGGGEFMDKWREDYSLLLGERGAVDFAVHTTPDGVRLDLHQECREGIFLGVEGRAGRLKIENSTGRIRVMGVKIESQREQTRAVTEA